MINLFKTFVHPSASERVKEVLESGYLAEGPQVLKFEEELAKEFGVSPDNVVTTNSCTSALQLCFEHAKRTYGIKRVISTPLTCAATNMAIVAAGLDIIWADINPNTLNIDLEDVEKKLDGEFDWFKLSQDGLGLAYVNWGGNVVDYKELNLLGQKYYHKYGLSLTVVEDAAHCWSDSVNYDNRGESYNNHYTCLSTQAIKYLTTGDGGFIVADNAENLSLHRKMRWFGLDRTKGGFRSNQDIKEWGFKFHMNDVAASIGRANLPYVSENVRNQKNNGQFLRRNLKGHKKLRFVEIEPGSSSWLLTALVEDRPKFIEKMFGAGIEVNQVHQRNDKLTCFERYKDYLPNMDSVEDKYVVIPCGFWLSEEDLNYIVKIIKEGW